MRYYYFFSILFSLTSSYSYIENWIEAPSYLNTSGAGKSIARERLSIYQNPAILQPSKSGFSLNTYRPFGIHDIQISHGGMYWDFKKIGTSFNWLHTHIESIYRENVFQVQQSWNFYPKWNIGVSLTKEFLQIPQLGKGSGATATLGSLWYPHSQVSLGGYIRNLWTRGFLNSETAPNFHWGGSLNDPSQRIFIYLDFSHDIQYTYSIPYIWKRNKYQIGKKIILSSHLWLYGGFQNKPYQLSFGIQLLWKGWNLKHSTALQKILGKTFHQGINYHFP